jgi:chemotaxis protein MotA
MNLLALVGLALAGLVFAFGVLTATNNPRMFLDMHALLIVFGGSLAATSIAFRIDRMFVLFKVFFIRILGGSKTSYVQVIGELMRVADAYRRSPLEAEKLLKESKEHFLKEAMSIAMEGLFDRPHLENVLRNRIAAQFHRYSEEAIKFRTVGKYPPAFGLLGTTLGMIALLSRLGEPGGQKLIGPAMSIALVATFWGLALANLVFGPVSENLLDSARETKLKHTIIAEGVLMIIDRTNPLILAEELNSFLLPGERIDWRKGTKALKQDGKAA